MTTARIYLPLGCPEAAPEGLWEALAAACRLVEQREHVEFRGQVWECEGNFWAAVWVDGLPEIWRWEEGEPVFVREGGI
jgi:hypothetical protein